MRRATTDKKSLSNVNSIVKKANSKLQELQNDLQELDAHILVNTGQTNNKPSEWFIYSSQSRTICI